MSDILVVDDDQAIANAFQRFLAREGHACTIASNAEDAIRLVGERNPDLVMMDIRMPGVDGLQALQQLRVRYPDVHVVMMTAHGTSQTSIEAMRAGAFEYVTKPLDLDQLRIVIRRALDARESLKAADEAATEAVPAVALVGDTPAMQEAYKLIGRLAANDVPALVLGERGTGKELVVATIHANSARREAPFVTADCDLLPEQVLESELFSTQGGTLHLAGVHALPRALQARLTRAIGESRTRGAGRTPSIPRVIATTDRDLAQLVSTGAFSHELYEALSVVTLRLPPLRARIEDIPALVRHFISRCNEELSRSIRGADDRVMQRLQAYAWPGNVGELENTIRRACIVSSSDLITVDDLGESLTGSRPVARQELETALHQSLKGTLQERLVEKTPGAASTVFHDIVGQVESVLVKEALIITGGNQVKASELLGLNRATLRKKASE